MSSPSYFRTNRNQSKITTPRSTKLFATQLEDRVTPATFLVNMPGDAGVGAGMAGDIRFAIDSANALAGADDIVFDTAAIGGSTIALTNGQLQITEDLTVTGPTPTATSISFDAGAMSRVFEVTTGIVLISNATITGGNASPVVSATPGNQGGNIFNAGTLTLANVVVSNGLTMGTAGTPGTDGVAAGSSGTSGTDGTDAEGGGVYNSGTLTITGATFTNNVAQGGAGGIGGRGADDIAASAGNGGSGGDGGDALGGAIHNANGPLTVTNGIFTSNQAISGRGGNGGNAGNTTTAGNGGIGGIGGESGEVRGGGLYNVGGDLQLIGTNFISNIASSDVGGDGGLGGNAGSTSGNGGSGGSGGDSESAYGGGVSSFEGDVTVTGGLYGMNQVRTGAGGVGGIGGNGVSGDGGNGGSGGTSGTGWGGGLSVSDEPVSITVTNTPFESNSIQTGRGGVGGLGGNANLTTGTGGDGGSGGRSGSTWGGGFDTTFRSGTNIIPVEVRVIGSPFTSNSGVSGIGGNGGNGGSGDTGGNGNNAGNSRSTWGGGLSSWNNVGPLALVIENSAFTGNSAMSAEGGQAAAGGNGGDGTSQGGSGGTGGYGGSPWGGGINTSDTFTFDLNNSPVTGNSALSGRGGNGGNGGNALSPAGDGGNGGTAGSGASTWGGGIALDFRFGGAGATGDSSIIDSSITGNLNRTGGGGSGGNGGLGGINGGGGNGSTGGYGGSSWGGGLMVTGSGVGSTLTLERSPVTGNIATSQGGGTGGAGATGGTGGNGGSGNSAGTSWGGGITDSSDLLLSLIDSSVTNNSATTGAGGAGGAGGEGTNGAGGNGGSGGQGNSTWGGGIMKSDGPGLTLLRSNVTGNSATAGTAAIGGAGGNGTTSGGNGGNGGRGDSAWGGGIDFTSSDAGAALTITDSTIANNTLTSGRGAAGGAGGNGAAGAGGNGGNGGGAGSVWGGGIHHRTPDGALLTRTNVVGNQAIGGNAGNGGNGGTGTTNGGNGGDGGRTSSVYGGGISNSNGSLSIIDSSIVSNVASSGNGGNGGLGGNGGTGTGGDGGDGGDTSEVRAGIYYNDNDTVTLTNVTIGNNIATGGNGGNGGNAGTGTGAANGGDGGNTDDVTGGLYFDGTIADVINATIAGNQANSGIVGMGGSPTNGGTAGTLGTVGTAVGGLEVDSGTFNVGNTIVATNSGSAGDLLGTFTSAGNNLIGVVGTATGFAGTDITGVTAAQLNLGPLQNNGGNTLTFDLLAGSIALDAGNDALVPGGVTNDQRGPGFNRLVGTVDVGALELEAGTTNVQVIGGVLMIDDVLGDNTNDTLTLTVVGPNLRITDPANLLRARSGATLIDPNTVEVSLARITGGILIKTLGGNDSVTFDLSGGPIPGPISYDGGTETDTESIIGSAGNDLFTYTPSGTNVAVETPTGGPSTVVNSVAVEFILLDGSGGTDTLRVTEFIPELATPGSGNFAGPPSVMYQSMEAVSINQVPVASPDNATVTRDSSVIVNILANDTGLADAPLSVTITSPAVNGTVTVNADNSVTYTPNAGFTGADSFIYRVSDANGESAIATVNVVVLPTTIPIAMNDMATVVSGGMVIISVLDNDTGLSDTPLTVTLSSPPANGTATVNADNTITYIATAGFVGIDSFTYTITDADGDSSTATVNVTVNPIIVTNQPPIAQNDSASTTAGQAILIDVLANDSDPDGDPLSFVSIGTAANGTISVVGTQLVYTPNVGFTGSDSFTYTIGDGNGGTATATVTLNVMPGVVPPTPPFNQSDVTFYAIGAGPGGGGDVRLFGPDGTLSNTFVPFASAPVAFEP